MRNLKIDKKGKKAELELSFDFYPENVLKGVAKDFGKVLNVGIEREGNKFIVTLKPRSNRLGIEEVSHEFINYLLAEVKSKMKRV